jgi:hypothetical protein
LCTQRTQNEAKKQSLCFQEFNKRYLETHDTQNWMVYFSIYKWGLEGTHGGEDWSLMGVYKGWMLSYFSAIVDSFPCKQISKSLLKTFSEEAYGIYNKHCFLVHPCCSIYIQGFKGNIKT